MHYDLDLWPFDPKINRAQPRLIPVDTKHRFNVVLTLIWGRDVQQQRYWFQCRGNNPFSMLYQRLTITFKQRQISKLKQLQISTLKQRQISTLKISTLKQRHISMLKYRQILTLKQSQILSFIHFNKIKYLFNVEVRRCFNLYLPLKILKFTWEFHVKRQIIIVITYCLFNYGNYHDK